MKLSHKQLLSFAATLALSATPGMASDATARIQITSPKSTQKRIKLPPTVIWLKPLSGSTAIPATQSTPIILQKNKAFSPHLVVVPTGSSISFPNADPFFHNVFSLFDGKRFDLGLYEAGSTRSVTFSREGVSYIFCNIHPEMSAVVIALTTPYYGISDEHGLLHLTGVPEGDYELHLWAEGERPTYLERFTRKIHIGPKELDIGTISLEHPDLSEHLNKFGQPYDHSLHDTY